MWLVGTVAVVIVAIGILLRTLGRRKAANPVDGLSVSQSWIVSQRGNSDHSP